MSSCLTCLRTLALTHFDLPLNSLKPLVFSCLDSTPRLLTKPLNFHAKIPFLDCFKTFVFSKLDTTPGLLWTACIVWHFWWYLMTFCINIDHVLQCHLPAHNNSICLTNLPWGLLQNNIVIWPTLFKINYSSIYVSTSCGKFHKMELFFYLQIYEIF